MLILFHVKQALLKINMTNEVMVDKKYWIEQKINGLWRIRKCSLMSVCKVLFLWISVTKNGSSPAAFIKSI
jgi:hypothetical protein